MDITSTQLELGKEPGTDMKEGVYTLPVLHALHRGPDRQELRHLLAQGAPDGERLVRALQVVRGEGPTSHARGAVGAEVRRRDGRTSAASGRPTSAGSTPSARVGPRARSATTFTDSCS